jgi:hypothetical protein
MRAFGLGIAVGAGGLAPGAHGDGDVAGRQVHQARHHRGLVRREQLEGIGVEIGGKGVDLAARQHPVPPQPRAERQGDELAGPSRGGGGPGAGHATAVGQPRGHRRRPLQLSQTGRTKGDDGVADAGIQPVAQGHHGSEGVAVHRDVEPLYDGAQLLEHPMMAIGTSPISATGSRSRQRGNGSRATERRASTWACGLARTTRSTTSGRRTRLPPRSVPSSAPTTVPRRCSPARTW